MCVAFSGLTRGRKEKVVMPMETQYSWSPAPQPLYHTYHARPMQPQPAAHVRSHPRIAEDTKKPAR